jgi:uncharacterized protein
MGERTSHPPGAFSWAELVTSDAAGAKSFYGELFAWEYDDLPIPDAGVYSMAKRGGRTVAALYAGDDPPHWNCYVTVASVEDTVARVADLGGTVPAEPFDVMEAGRMAVIADPAGAPLCLWTAGTSIGAELVNAPGAMSWNDLVTPDPEGAAEFYGALFGWETQPVPDAGGYRVIRNGGRGNGGIMPLDPDRMGAETPPSWMPYFGHEDVGRVIREIDGLGGRVFNGPVQILDGTIAVLGDPQGAVFAAWTGDYDD